MDQEIRFCQTSDNVRIAYASVGSGPPLVKAANWLNHLEYDWESPVWKHLLEEFSRDHTFIRSDERGNGLSDWKVDLSFESFVNDLESVVDSVGLDKFPLLGISQGAAVAIEYAVRHPEKVSHLILFGAFAAGWSKSGLPEHVIEKRRAQLTLIRHGWGQHNPAFRQLWTNLCIPDATPEEVNSYTDLQRISTSPENAATLFEAIGDVDVVHLLPKLKLPVLVLHSIYDATVPFEEGRRLASLIPDARFVALESRNHLLMRHEPAWARFVQEVRRFLGCEIERPLATAEMSGLRTCPSCSRVFTDPSLNYCLDDGTRLAGSASDDVPTQIIQSHFPSDT